MITSFIGWNINPRGPQFPFSDSYNDDSNPGLPRTGLKGSARDFTSTSRPFYVNSPPEEPWSLAEY
jgi:hypothetical protein